jgi:hypothetical protein
LALDIEILLADRGDFVFWHGMILKSVWRYGKVQGI